MSDIITVNCPTCNKPVIWGEQSPYRPFCSKRCQLIDLGEWAAEEKRIPSSGDLSDSDDWSEEQQQIRRREQPGVITYQPAISFSITGTFAGGNSSATKSCCATQRPGCPSLPQGSPSQLSTSQNHSVMWRSGN